MLTYETIQSHSIGIHDCSVLQLHRVSSLVFSDYSTLFLICIAPIISCA